jgi:hypothetical protein
MNRKTLSALAAALALMGTASIATAQVGKAASEASDSVEHKMEQKQAESDAKKSGPVGKAVNKTKAKYHKSRSKNSADKAKQSLKNAG